MFHYYSYVLKFFASAFILKILLSLIKYHWRRRWLYYRASKFDGPLSWPLIGNANYFMGSLRVSFTTYEDTLKICANTQLDASMSFGVFDYFFGHAVYFTGKALDLVNINAEVFRLWILNYLFIVNSKPEDVEIILSKCLVKPFILYKILTGNLISSSILVSPVNQWRKNRKLINHTFNPKIINSFHEHFIKSSNIWIEEISQKNLNEAFDIFQTTWSYTFQTTLATIFDIDQENMKEKSKTIVAQVMRAEEIFSLRLFKAWLYPKFLWKLSPLHKEVKSIISETHNFINKLIEYKKSQEIDDESKRTRFINHLISNESEITEKELFDDSLLMLIASSESTAVTISFLLLIFAIYPEIQKKAYEEVYTVFGDSGRDADVEDLSRMEYLERVIKETLRLFPTFLVTARYVEKDFKLGDYVYPKGSTIVIPIMQLHRSPKLWKDPLRFDPDRFLPEETRKRHRCSYIPFNYGPRNCPGSKYAMMSMKTMLSKFMRHYEVISCNYKNIEDIKLVFHLVAKPHKGFKVILSKRV